MNYSDTYQVKKSDLRALIVLLFLISGISYVSADFVGPTETAPICTSGNPGCDAPINTGPTEQTKAGSFIIQGNSTTTGNQNISGNLILNVTDPDKKIWSKGILGATGPAIFNGKLRIGNITPAVDQLDVIRSDVGGIASFIGKAFSTSDAWARIHLKNSDASPATDWFLSMGPSGDFSIHQGSVGDSITLFRDGRVGVRNKNLCDIDGTNCNAGGGSSFPKNMVAYFADIGCPVGWSPANGANGTVNARGRYLIGTPSDADSTHIVTPFGNNDLKNSEIKFGRKFSAFTLNISNNLTKSAQALTQAEGRTDVSEIAPGMVLYPCQKN